MLRQSSGIGKQYANILEEYVIASFFYQTTEVLLTAARLSESPACWSNSCQGKRGESILTIRLLLDSEQSQTYSESGEQAFRGMAS